MRSGRSRFRRAPSRHMSAAVRETVSAETSTANQSSPLSTTVRQTPEQAIDAPRSIVSTRSEERRVGKECRSRWAQHTYKKSVLRVLVPDHGTTLSLALV